MNGANQEIEYYQYSKSKLTRVSSRIIAESPVSLTVNGSNWMTFMCTPIDLEALAIGFLYNEGFIEGKDDIASVRVCPHYDNVDVWLNKQVEQPKKWRRTTGCTGGITSVEDNYQIDRQLQQSGLLKNEFSITAENVTRLTNELLISQKLYRTSGGVHTSILTDGGKTHVIAEDIGRHNTLDKIAGICILNNIYFKEPILLSTGRVSSDMMQKAISMKAIILISRTSPSTLSIEMAQRHGITLVGYARRNSFRAYTHPERILSHMAIQI